MRTILTIIRPGEIPAHPAGAPDPLGFFDEISVKPGYLTSVVYHYSLWEE